MLRKFTKKKYFQYLKTQIKELNVLFFGSDEFSLSTLKELNKSEFVTNLEVVKKIFFLILKKKKNKFRYAQLIKEKDIKESYYLYL